MNSKTDPKVSGLEEQYRAGRISRREFIRQAVFLGVSLSGISAFLASCAAPPPTPVPASAASPTSGVRPTIAPTATAAPTGPYGELKVAVATFSQGIFNPVRASGTTYESMLLPMLEYLVRKDSLGVSVGIAEKWEMASDGLSWTFHIRKGVKFHNGDDLTAKDVKFSLDSYAGKDAYFTHIRESQDTVDVVDDYTVRVRTKGVQPRYAGYVDAKSGLQGVIFPKDYIEKNGWDYYEKHPIGTGPFKLIRFVPGDVIEYEALDKHYRETASFKKLTIMMIPEEATRVAMLKTGAVDAVAIGVDSAEAVEAAGLRTVAMAGNSACVQFFGAYDPRSKTLPVGDLRVREALSLAIDRVELARTFFAKKLQPPMPLFMWQDQAEVDVPLWKKEAASFYRYDPETAKRLLKEAGYPDAFTNSTIKIFSYSTGGGEYLPALAPVIQGYWLKIGVKAEIVPIEEAAHRALRRSGPNKGPGDPLNGQATLFGSGGSGADIVRSLVTYFSAAGAIDLTGGGMGQNQELDKLIQAAASEIDGEKRSQILAKAVRMAMETRVWETIGTVPMMTGLGPRIEVNLPEGARSIPMFAETVRHKAL